MVRSWTLITALGLALAPAAYAMGQQAGAAPPPDVQAKFQQAAAKSCNYDLDHGSFGDYSTMDDCVSAKTDKMTREYRRDPSAAQASAEAALHRPD